MLRLDRNPLPALGVLRVRADGLQVAGEAYLGAGSSPDVVGGTPGFSLKQIYTYCVWLRSTPATRLLLAQAEARTFGGQDAQVLSEELNWGAGANASCCHSNCLAKQFSVAKPPPAPARPCASQAELPLAPPPPNRTRNSRHGQGMEAGRVQRAPDGGAPLWALHRPGRGVLRPARDLPSATAALHAASRAGGEQEEAGRCKKEEGGSNVSLGNQNAEMQPLECEG